MTDNSEDHAVITEVENMRQQKVLKLYSNEKEPFYSFEPVDMKYAPDWDMYYEQWHQYKTPLHIIFYGFFEAAGEIC